MLGPGEATSLRARRVEPMGSAVCSDKSLFLRLRLYEASWGAGGAMVESILATNLLDGRQEGGVNP